MQEQSPPHGGRKQVVFFVLVALAGLALRLFLVFRYPAVVDDSRLYADIARNWLEHGIYGITNSNTVMPTLSRLPGYPLFLATVFKFAGHDKFRAVLLLQVLFDLGTCCLIADLARRRFSPRAAQAAFLMSCLCPFLASYAAAALTETLEIFFTTLAFDFIFRALGIGSVPRHSYAAWIGCGLSVGAAILLRPDGGILLAAIGLYLGWILWRAVRTASRTEFPEPRSIIAGGILIALFAAAPLVPWTLRNLHTFHRFEPLAPRYANDSDEAPMPGFNRWVKTWIADYVSVQEIYWNVPGEDIDVGRLPSRAFDTTAQRQTTVEVLADYNREHEVTPEIDASFAQLASERIHAAPLRYYVWLPSLRIADMWLRPRTELTSADPRWWEFNDDRKMLVLSLGFALANLAYVVLGLAGWLRARRYLGIGLFVMFVLIRSLFLGTLENPEPRYTLECYPAVIFLAAALFNARTE